MNDARKAQLKYVRNCLNLVEKNVEIGISPFIFASRSLMKKTQQVRAPTQQKQIDSPYAK